MQCRSYTLGKDDKRERCWGTVRYVCAAIGCFIENNTEGVGVFAGGPSQLTTSANGLPPLLTPTDCKMLNSQFKVSSIQEALLLLAQKELAMLVTDGLIDPSFCQSQQTLQQQLTELRSEMNSLLKLRNQPIPREYVQAIYLAVVVYAVGCAVSGHATMAQAVLYWGYEPDSMLAHELVLALGPFVFVAGMLFWMDVSLLFTRAFENTEHGGLRFQAMAVGAIKSAHEISFASIEAKEDVDEGTIDSALPIAPSASDSTTSAALATGPLNSTADPLLLHTAIPNEIITHARSSMQ